jgi:hypothetical protein
MALKIVKYTDLIPRMMRDLKNYSREATVFALQDSGREFCNRSECWFENLTAIDIVANQQNYTMSFDYPAQIKRIKSVHILSATEVTNGDEGTLIAPNLYSLVLPQTLKFKADHEPRTAVTGGLVVEVVFTPDMGANEIAEWVVSRWSEGIIGKAMHGLLKVSDPRTAAVYLNDFNSKLGEAMADSITDPTPGGEGYDTQIQVQEYSP